MFSFTIGGLPLEILLLAISLMMILSVLSSKASSFLGVPSLILFLGIGMLAGSEGPGRIDFTNYPLAFLVGSISLAFILFDGGLKTSWEKIRPILGIGISFSTLGVLFTCLLTGGFAHFVFGLNWLDSFLLGAIVSSTDAAAVFSILRSKNLYLKGSLKQTLEFEAGSNDPTAIFLTVGFLSLVTTPSSTIMDFILLFILQAGIGAVSGWVGGKLTAWLLNKVKVDYDGLYPVLLVSMVLLIFSFTSAVGGSGFLAVYIAGLIVGNSTFLRKQGLILFNDGIGWLSQILLFLVLGLLVFPSHLLEVWKEGVLITLFMMVVARPLSVFLAAPKSSLTGKERLFISWVGLRGAAPIILAILPWSAQYPGAEYFFNIVFFIVIFSIIFQGSSIPWVATKLGITGATEESTDNNLVALPQGFITIELRIDGDAPAAGKRVVDLNLPPGVLLISLERKQRYMIPKGETVFEKNDKLVALGRLSNLTDLKKIFGHGEPVRFP